MPDVLLFLQSIPPISLALFWIATVLLGYLIGDAMASISKPPTKPKGRHSHKVNGKFAKRVL